MEKSNTGLGKLAVIAVLLAALATSLFLVTAMPGTANAKTYGSAHVTKKVGKAYSKYLKTHKVKYFTVKSLGGKTKALVACKKSDVFPMYPRNPNVTGVTICMYKKGKVRKIGRVDSIGSEGFRYTNKALVRQHNHWADLITVKRNGRMLLRSADLWYSTSAPMYRGYNYNTSYSVNGKTKYSGVKAIDKYYSVFDKYRGGKYLKVVKNNAKNRKRVLGFK